MEQYELLIFTKCMLLIQDVKIMGKNVGERND